MIEKFTSPSESAGDARQMPAPESKTAVSKPLEILLVEDSAGDGLIIHDVLKQSPTPVNVHLARDGEQALLILSDRFFRPDLVILDLNLPKVSGYELLQRDLLRGIPVVVFTSAPNEADTRRALALGVRECIHKPVSLKDYRKAVLGIVEKWAARKHTSAGV
jgi:two-component system, chemotaxis family, response regulator Rcp1